MDNIKAMLAKLPEYPWHIKYYVYYDGPINTVVSEDAWNLADLNYHLPNEKVLHEFIRQSPEIVENLVKEVERLQIELESLRGGSK